MEHTPPKRWMSFSSSAPSPAHKEGRQLRVEELCLKFLMERQLENTAGEAGSSRVSQVSGEKGQCHSCHISENKILVYFYSK